MWIGGGGGHPAWAPPKIANDIFKMRLQTFTNINVKMHYNASTLTEVWNIKILPRSMPPDLPILVCLELKLIYTFWAPTPIEANLLVQSGGILNILVGILVGLYKTSFVQ